LSRGRVLGVLVAVLAASVACGFDATPAESPDPTAHLSRIHIRQADLPPPHETPSVANPPRVVARPPGAKLEAPAGFTVLQAAEGFDTPRRMALAPNGDVFLADAGAGTILVLRDPDGDGRFGAPAAFATGLRRPFGLAFAPGILFVGTEGAILRFPYQPGDRKASAAPVTVMTLPRGGHWTRDVLYDPTPDRVYVSVGSRSNAGEEAFPRASVFWFARRAGRPRPVPYATGLRNPVALAREPVTGAIWTVVNEMDGLGDELPPDWAAALEEGGFYGWPYAYAGNNPVPGLPAKHQARVAAARRPEVLLRAHSAPLGIAFYTHEAFPPHFRGGAFVALHGSWNARGRRGYEVVFLPFEGGKARGWSERFLRGWALAPDRREVWGRPVGLLVDRDGSLLVSEDGQGTLWRVRHGEGG
jgi:glucose/arabinose dehydrogenase